MEWLNYHHLLYFWTVAKEGSIARAGEKLRLAQPTISGQIRALEESFGEKLFQRVGRRLVLTEMGRLVYRYADEIFTLGRELGDAVKGRPTGRPVRFTVGVADVMPKLIAARLLAPALRLKEPVRMICREDKPEPLLAELGVHELDLVLTDSPLGGGVSIRAFNHLLGECDVSFFAAPSLKLAQKTFPRCLDGAPFLMPMEGSTLRRSLEQWFDEHDLRPRIACEFDDSALLKTFGQSGVGAFAAPAAIAEEIARQYGVQEIGRTAEVRERFYAISAERRLKHPAVIAISQAARERLFS